MYLPPILDFRDDLFVALAAASDGDGERLDDRTASARAPPVGSDDPDRDVLADRDGALADRDEEDGERDRDHGERDDEYRDRLDDDLADEYEAAVERLRAFAERDEADRQGLLDDVDNQLLRVQEKVDDDASRRIEAIRDRIHVYREELSQPGANLVVTNAGLRTADGDDATVAELRGQEGVVWADLVNNGPERRATVEASFVDEWGDVVAAATGPTVALDAGEDGTFEFSAGVPEDAFSYVVVPSEVA